MKYHDTKLCLIDIFDRNDIYDYWVERLKMLNKADKGVGKQLRNASCKSQKWAIKKSHKDRKWGKIIIHKLLDDDKDFWDEHDFSDNPDSKIFLGEGLADYSINLMRLYSDWRMTEEYNRETGYGYAITLNWLGYCHRAWRRFWSFFVANWIGFFTWIRSWNNIISLVMSLMAVIISLIALYK
jgi:hypothetical protein